jgi:hypothetical protein
MFFEYHRGKPEDVGILFAPALWRHPGLEARFLQKPNAVPVLFDRNLRQQNALAIALFDKKPMFTHMNLSNVHDSPQGRKHGDLVVQAGQFRR